MRELAQALGLGKSALYKHYASKEDIWNSMLDALEAHYSEGFGADDNLPPILGSCDELVEMSMGMVGFTMHDERIVLTRRLLLAGLGELLLRERSRLPQVLQLLVELHGQSSILDARLTSYASTAPRYSMYKAPASRTDPTMSVAQCTPETCLPATMKAENTMTNIAVALLGDALSDLLPTWSFNVGITLSTSSVAYELEFSSRACGPGVCESSPQFSYCSDASAIAA